MDNKCGAESFQPPIIKSQGDKWDGEDEEEDVKNNWEDGEEEEKKDEEKVEELKALPVTKKKKKLAEKTLEREVKEKELLAREIAAKEALKPETPKNVSPEEKLTKKMKKKRLQEKADLQITKETFGIIETSDSIDARQPSTKEEFNLLEEALVRKLQPLAVSAYYPTFIENLTRNIGADLNVSNLKKIRLAVENLIIEKKKAETGNTKKGAAKTKPLVCMEGKNPEEIAAEREEKKAQQAMRAKEMQEMRTNNVVIYGIPFKVGEDVEDIAFLVISKYGMEIERTDIIACQRSTKLVSGLKRKRNPDIIVGLRNYDLKCELIESYKKVLKETGRIFASNIKRSWPQYSIYIHEHMTEATKELFKAAKVKGNEFGWKVWTADCVIYAKKSNTPCAPKFRISSTQDIHAVIRDG